MDTLLDLWRGLPPLARLLMIGLGVALPLLALGFRPLKWVLIAIGKTRGFAPNWLTIWRFPCVWGGFYWYMELDAYIGFALVVLGFMLDRMDGKVAEAHGDEVAEFDDTIDELNHPGKTKMGGWLDPLIDKLTIVPILLYFCIKGELWLPLGILILLVETIGTIVRPPFKLINLKLRRVSAGWAGKTKFGFMCATLLVYLPVDRGWEAASAIPNYFLATAATFTLLSFVSKVEFRGWLAWINRAFDRLAFLDGAFKHN